MATCRSQRGEQAQCWWTVSMSKTILNLSISQTCQWSRASPDDHAVKSARSSSTLPRPTSSPRHRAIISFVSGTSRTARTRQSR